MRRAAWIFFASIFLPSLALAWLAVHSARDQQVVLEHQQAIICQNITDTLAKEIQNQMDGVRGDFVKTTQQLLTEKPSPEILAQNFNRTLRTAWPAAGIGFAVNLTGHIYSPTPYDGPEARTFRDENDRFLSNRENVEVYASNSVAMNQSASNASQKQEAAQFSLKLPTITANENADASRMKKEIETKSDLSTGLAEADAIAAPAKDAEKRADIKTAATSRGSFAPAAELPAPTSVVTGSASAIPPGDAGGAVSAPKPALDYLLTTKSKSVPAAAAVRVMRDEMQSEDKAARAPDAPAKPPPVVTTAPAAPPPPAQTLAPATPQNVIVGGELETSAVPSSTVVNSPAPMAAPDAATVIKTSPQPSTNASQFNANGTLNANGSQLYNNSTAFGKVLRQVVPQQTLARATASLSNTVPEESDFRRVIGSETSGELARFLEDKMRLLVWFHPATDAPIVFGAQLDRDKLVETLRASLQIPELKQDSYSRSSDGDLCAAILDDAGNPVALSRPGFTADWKHPFVATEIGEVLPHWEAALYLVDPQQFSRAARTLQLTFGLIVLLLVAAIVAGGSLIGADVRRQVRLAQQKTDFVSNVSHELKTPLTSIRMFADLLAEKRVPDEERQATYLRIIAAEASRLTRLINNVLDFARLEKGAPHGEHAACDLVEAVRDVAGTCGPHLEAAGIAFQCEIEAETLPIRGDRDALAQIILNLISNAEKYGGSDILVRVRRQETPSGVLGCVDVLDRGAGIPARQVKTVFEPFQRLDDSLSSGIPGSGLGLTLARRMARAHGGDVTYSARAGDGSCFTLAVPLAGVA